MQLRTSLVPPALRDAAAKRVADVGARDLYRFTWFVLLSGWDKA
ncbi:MAG TPA: hypothetical protein VLH09_12300 [Bryobacteraceae bacterium]|nr:hypothetical protein [Bryobacteraceae bacterium]